MDFQLHDRVVVITGAGSGIGLATTQTFLGEGAKVVAADLDPSAAGELSDNVTALKVDMSTPDGAGFAVAETMRAFGRVDVQKRAARTGAMLWRPRGMHNPATSRPGRR